MNATRWCQCYFCGLWEVSQQLKSFFLLFETVCFSWSVTGIYEGCISALTTLGYVILADFSCGFLGYGSTCIDLPRPATWLLLICTWIGKWSKIDNDSLLLLQFAHKIWSPMTLAWISAETGNLSTFGSNGERISVIYDIDLCCSALNSIGILEVQSWNSGTSIKTCILLNFRFLCSTLITLPYEITGWLNFLFIIITWWACCALVRRFTPKSG